ncbi:MAG: hypothetical protein PVG72_07375 [Gammaproteobacteria bacterium]|jgi:hypothetical protein
MTNDIKTHGSSDPAAQNNQLPDDVVADPVAVVLMLQQEAGHRQREDKRLSVPLKQAALKEKVLRRMLENSLESAATGKRPNLKIVK